MTSSTQPTISPADRVAPQRATKPAKAAAAPMRRPWLAATILSIGTFVVVGGGFASYQMLTTGEAPKPRMSAIKLGPLPEMPDLRNGVPALMPSRSAVPAAQQAANTSPAPIAQAEDANRKAMASTVAAANLRPALAAPSTPAKPAPSPSIRAESEAPKPAPAAAASVAAAEPAPVRQVEIKRPTETASLGEPKPSVAAPAPAAAAPVPAPRPIEAAREAAPPAQPRVASLPTDAPLPPRKPSLQAAEPAAERAADRPTTAKPRPVAAQARPAPAAAPQTVASAQEVRSPAPAAEEDRSILGVPVPRFVPTGRDIRDAAATVGNAITSIPDRF